MFLQKFILSFLWNFIKFNLCLYAVEYGTEHGDMNAAAGNGNNTFDPANPDARGEGIDEQDISQEITKLRPDAYPLDTIMRNLSAKSEKVQSPEVKYYQQSSKPWRGSFDPSVDSGTGASAASPANHYTYASGNGITSIFVQVVDSKLFRTKDTILVSPCTVTLDSDGVMQLGASASTNATYEQLFHVLSKSGNVLELQPIGGMLGTGVNAKKYVVPNFAESANIYRCGSAMAEKDLKTESFGIIPEASTNFCQKFMAQIEETTWQKLWKKEINYDMTDMEADTLFEFRGEIEMSYLFGNKFFKEDSVDGRIYFCEGIVRSLELSGRAPLEYGTGGADRTITNAMWMNWLRTLFTGNNGSATRVAFCGSGLIAAIELFQLTSSQKQMQINSTQDTYLGVKCTKIYNTFGELNIIRHPLFDEVGWADNGLVLDPQFLYKHQFEPTSVTNLDFKSSGIKDVDAKVIKETSCVTLRYPEVHAIIKPHA